MPELTGNQLFCAILCLLAPLLLGWMSWCAAKSESKVPPMPSEPVRDDTDARHRQDVIDAHFAGVPREERDQ